jgi:hypothetical protein
MAGRSKEPQLVHDDAPAELGTAVPAGQQFVARESLRPQVVVQVIALEVAVGLADEDVAVELVAARLDDAGEIDAATRHLRIVGDRLHNRFVE